MPTRRPKGEPAHTPAPPTDDGAHLVELRADGFLGLQAVAIRPTGQIVEITGPNGAGKTSCLKALWAVLKGKAALQAKGQPPQTALHDDVEEATLVGDFGAKLHVQRTIKKDGDGNEIWSSLRVTVDGGTRRITNSPQAFLDALVGPDLWLDPLEFSRWDAKKQADAVRRLVPGFDFVANQQLRDRVFADRTDVNRDAQRAESAAALVQLPAGPEPEAVDVKDVMAQLDAAISHNADVTRRQENLTRAQDDIDAKEEEAERLRARANTLDEEAAALKARLAAAGELPLLKNTADLQDTITTAGAVSEVRAAFARRRELEAQAKTARDTAAVMSTEIDRLDKAKADAIAAAKLPVPGLAFDDNGLTLNGRPFVNASTAERLRTAVALAMATCGDLKLVLIDEGSELDSKSMAIIADMVAGTPFVVLVCRVDETGQRGFVLNEGRLVHTPKGG